MQRLHLAAQMYAVEVRGSCYPSYEVEAQRSYAVQVRGAEEL